MRTLSKDILMICKMWYNHNTDTSVSHALSTYIEHYTMCLPDRNTLNHFLGYAVKKFVTVGSLVSMLREHSESLLHKNEDPELFIMNTYISLLQLRTITDIDLKDYDKVEQYFYINPSAKDMEWWEYFTDKVEDDRY